jgi:hypothetical protein
MSRQGVEVGVVVRSRSWVEREGARRAERWHGFARLARRTLFLWRGRLQQIKQLATIASYGVPHVPVLTPCSVPMGFGMMILEEDWYVDSYLEHYDSCLARLTATD